MKSNVIIQNSAEGVVIITLSGEVGESWFGDGITLDTIRSQVIKGRDVEINITSEGGSLIEAFAIYDYLRAIPNRVTVNMLGMVASSGTLIAMAGERRRISEHGKFLIHNCWTVTQGDSEDHQRAAELLERYDREIVEIYHKHTGLDRAIIQRLMSEERPLDATEAIKYGFAHEILSVYNLKNLNDMKQVKNQEELTPAEVINLLEQVNERLTSVEGRISELLTTIESLATRIDALEQTQQLAKEEVVDATVDLLKQEGRVTAETEESVRKMLKNNYSETLTALRNVPVIRFSQNWTATSNNVKGWDDYSYAELDQLRKEKPEFYNSLLQEKIKQIKGGKK